MLPKVDAIYAIALPERKDDIVSELNKKGIIFEVFNAIKDENGIKGLQLSIKAVFENVLSKGCRNVLIFEDDSEFVVNDPFPIMNKCIDELPFDYDCLQFGVNMVSRPKRYSENLFKVYYSHSTHCILYSKKAMLHILSILDYKTHLDTLIHKYLQPLGNFYCSDKIIVNQKDGYSYIEKRNMKYGTIMKDKFQKMTAGL